VETTVAREKGRKRAESHPPIKRKKKKKNTTPPGAPHGGPVSLEEGEKKRGRNTRLFFSRENGKGEKEKRPTGKYHLLLIFQEGGGEGRKYL